MPWGIVAKIITISRTIDFSRLLLFLKNCYLFCIKVKNTNYKKYLNKMPLALFNMTRVDNVEFKTFVLRMEVNVYLFIK